MDRDERRVRLVDLLRHVLGHLTEAAEMADELQRRDLTRELFDLMLQLGNVRHHVFEPRAYAPLPPSCEDFGDQLDLPF
jgi:hypothetical protein